jgi:AcrR family transcriptional regulator
MTTATNPRRESQRREQAAATRALLLRTAERLYAERGLHEVSNRQVAEAAGQANNSAVAYHIGTKADVVKAISATHLDPIIERTREMVVAARGSADPRDHIACLIRPYVDHLAALGTPSTCARFIAQISTDPTVDDRPFEKDALDELTGEAYWAMRELAPPMPTEVARLRHRMTRVLLLHTCAEQEQAGATTGTPVDWALVGATLVDAATGVLTAPIG